MLNVVYPFTFVICTRSINAFTKTMKVSVKKVTFIIFTIFKDIFTFTVLNVVYPFAFIDVAVIKSHDAKTRFFSFIKIAIIDVY